MSRRAAAARCVARERAGPRRRGMARRWMGSWRGCARGGAARAEREGGGGARAQLAEAGKKLRQAEVYRKGHEDSTKKLRKLTAEHERQGQEVIELRISLSELTNAKQQLLDETARANDAVAAAERRAAAAEEGARQSGEGADGWSSNAAATRCTPRRRGRAAARAAAARQVLVGGRRRGAQAARGRDRAASPRARRRRCRSRFLAKAVREVASLEMATQESAAREEEMLAMLVAHMRDDPPPDASAGGASRPVWGTAATRSGVGR